ncbi:hypothetical protein GWI33_007079 [Rhynchophorus ferrugineus]|uniref:Uncharacterized protein n=1 Tax=Rhynchophorus ferrugineus TaxID=354439 RepID=A0A834IGI6_RHYFE|nr:hypothetical protein GWI33_007079 [Rhynchophorus ferrugineus]
MEPDLCVLNDGGAKAVPLIKVLKYRWVILAIFDLISILNFMQLLQFSIISNIVSKYYDVEDFYVDLTGLVFFISYILLFYPIGYLIEKYVSTRFYRVGDVLIYFLFLIMLVRVMI